MNVQINVDGQQAEIVIESGVTTPGEMAEAVAAADLTGVTVVGGRAPMWGNAMVLLAVAGVETEFSTYDPRLGRVVVSGPRRGEVDPA